jgi:hypothetical protein
MSQLNFFMTKDEVVEKIKSLNMKNQFAIFQGRFFDIKKPTPLVIMQDVGKSKELIIWVKNSLKEPECSTKGLENYLDNFLFDYYKDPIIEFSNCVYDNKLISLEEFIIKLAG